MSCACKGKRALDPEWWT